MARRRVYTGSYHCNRSRTTSAKARENLNLFVKCIKKKLNYTYKFVMDYYLLFGTLFFVFVISFVLPDFAHKINTNRELNSIKKIVNIMSNEVNRAEAACLTAADELCYLHCSMEDSSTETEVAIMSYVYTHSFDAIRPNVTERVM